MHCWGFGSSTIFRSKSLFVASKLSGTAPQCLKRSRNSKKHIGNQNKIPKKKMNSKSRKMQRKWVKTATKWDKVSWNDPKVRQIVNTSVENTQSIPKSMKNTEIWRKKFPKMRHYGVNNQRFRRGSWLGFSETVASVLSESFSSTLSHTQTHVHTDTQTHTHTHTHRALHQKCFLRL